MNKKNVLIYTCVVFPLLFAVLNLNAQTLTSQKTTQWHGFEKNEFLFNGIPAYYV